MDRGAPEPPLSAYQHVQAGRAGGARSENNSGGGESPLR